MRITNTRTKEAHPEWCLGGNPLAIEAQEARGQIEFIESQSLPTEIHGDRSVLEALGVQLGQAFPDDPMFCEAILPTGWKKRATEHAMWSELIDGQGNVQASIFYKAAFYDRRAFMRIGE